MTFRRRTEEPTLPTFPPRLSNSNPCRLSRPGPCAAQILGFLIAIASVLFTCWDTMGQDKAFIRHMQRPGLPAHHQPDRLPHNPAWVHAVRPSRRRHSPATDCLAAGRFQTKRPE